MSTDKPNNKKVESSKQPQQTDGADNRSETSVSSTQTNAAGQAVLRPGEAANPADVQQDKWSDNTRKEAPGRVASGSSSGVSSKASELSGITT